MNILPNYSRQISKENFETEFNTEFKGPGWYLTDTDTMLVIPNPSEGYAKVTAENIWDAWQPVHTIYTVLVYNAVYRDTIFNVLINSPVRHDTRKH